MPVILILAFRTPINRWWWRRNFNKRPDKDIEVECQFFPEKIVMDAILGHSEFIWDALYEVTQAKEGYLVFLTPQIFHWLPRHGFGNDEGYHAFAELARQRVKTFREIR